MAGKNKKGSKQLKGKDWNGPYINMKFSSRFNSYIKRYDTLMEDMDDILSIDNEKKRDDKLGKWKDSLKDVQEDLAKKVERETKIIKRQLSKVEKQLVDYDRQRERGGTEDAMARLEAKEAEARRESKELNGAMEALANFQKYVASSNKGGKGLESTAFGLIDRMAPAVKGKTLAEEDFDLAKVDEDFKVLIFFSLKNRDSLNGIREMFRLDGKKRHGKSVKVIYVNVDREKDEAEIEKRNTKLQQTIRTGTVLIDETNDICAAFRVGFLPHAVLLDTDNVAVKVALGAQLYRQLDDKIESRVKKK